MASTYVDGDGKPSKSMTQSSHLEAKAQWVLTDGLGIGDRYERSRYAPLKSFPALFLAFAELLYQNRDVILEFANKHGMLGLQRRESNAESGQPMPPLSVPKNGTMGATIREDALGRGNLADS